MPISDYLRGLRERVGTTRLLVPAVAAVIHDAEGRVLCQRRADGSGWSLPAGAIDPGETPAEAAVREVREETGLDVRPTRLLGVLGGRGYRTTYPNGDEVEFTVVVLACETLGGELGGLDGETAELRWFPPAEMPPFVHEYPAALFVPGEGVAFFH